MSQGDGKQNIRVLLAIAGDGDASYVTGVVDDLGAELIPYGIQITGYESTGDKSRAFELARKCSDYEVFLCTKYLGGKTESNLLTPSDIEQIQFLMPHANVIVCVDDTRGSDYLAALLDKSIYGAVLAEDMSLASLAELIARPRNRKMAVSYYGVSNISISTVEDGGETASQRVRYISQYIDQKDLENRLARTFEDASPDEINAVLCSMPDNVLNDIRNIEKYTISAGFALSQKRKAKGQAEVMETRLKDLGSEPQGPRRGRPAAGKKTVYGVVDVKDICFVGTTEGDGCTFTSILCAYSLAKAGYRTAIVELNDRETAFEELHKEIKEELRKKDKKKFDFGGVDFYYRTNFKEMGSERGKYDFIVYDAGALDPEEDADNIKGIIRNMHRIFIVASPMEYRQARLERFGKKLESIDVAKKACYMVPVSQPKDLGRIDLIAKGRKTESIPYEVSPFNPSKKTQELFTEYVLGEPKKADHGGKRDIAQKLTDRPKEPMTKLTYILAAAMLLVTVTAISVVAANLTEARVTVKKAETAIADMSSDLERSKKKASDLEDEIAGYETVCYMLVRPEAAGTLIEEDMIREVTVKTDLDKEIYASKEEIVGKYLTANLENDVPIYRYLVAREVKEKLPSFFFKDEALQKEDPVVTEQPAAEGVLQEGTEETS